MVFPHRMSGRGEVQVEMMAEVNDLQLRKHGEATVSCLVLTAITRRTVNLEALYVKMTCQLMFLRIWVD
jgi:hypothetical protein